MTPRKKINDDIAPPWAIDIQKQLKEIDICLRGSLDKPGLVSRLAAVERVAYGALGLGASLLLALLLDLLKTLLEK